MHTFRLKYKTITQSDLCRFHFYVQDCRIATGCSDSFWDFCIFWRSGWCINMTLLHTSLSQTTLISTPCWVFLVFKDNKWASTWAIFLFFSNATSATCFCLVTHIFPLSILLLSCKTRASIAFLILILNWYMQALWDDKSNISKPFKISNFLKCQIMRPIKWHIVIKTKVVGFMTEKSIIVF